MDLQPQISLKNKKTGEKKIYRLDQELASIGRDISNYIVVDSRTVSRKHAEIVTEKDQFFIRDLKSNNGTLLNEKKITPKEKVLLRSGDVIQIEDFDLLFHIPAAGEAKNLQEIHEATDSDLLEIKMVKKLLKAMDRDNAPSLEVLEGPKAGTRFVFEGKNQEVVVGRDPACEFQIDSEVISRKHIKIEKRFDTLTLKDLNSKNGTYVNRQRVGEKKLQDGDIIHLGTLTLAFRNPQDLTFDLAPPQLKEEKEEVKETPPPPPPAPPPSPAPSSAVENTERGRFKLSPAEIAAIAIGLVVLIGSIWGILQLLK